MWVSCFLTGQPGRTSFCSHVAHTGTKPTDLLLLWLSVSGETISMVSSQHLTSVVCVCCLNYLSTEGSNSLSHACRNKLRVALFPFLWREFDNSHFKNRKGKRKKKISQKNRQTQNCWNQSQLNLTNNYYSLINITSPHWRKQWLMDTQFLPHDQPFGREKLLWHLGIMHA